MPLIPFLRQHPNTLAHLLLWDQSAASFVMGLVVQMLYHSRVVDSSVVQGFALLAWGLVLVAVMVVHIGDYKVVQWVEAV